MTALLFVISVVAFVAGVAAREVGESVFHETEALILFLISAVCLCGAGVVGAVNTLRKELSIRSRRIEAHFTRLKESDYDY